MDPVFEKRVINSFYTFMDKVRMKYEIYVTAVKYQVRNNYLGVTVL